MELLLLDRVELPLHYKPNNGAWTYYIEIPLTKKPTVGWGKVKVYGKIDDEPLPERFLAPRKGQLPIISINKSLREALQKTGGDRVLVTLYMRRDE